MIKWIAMAGLLLQLTVTDLNAANLDIKTVTNADGISIEIVENGSTVTGKPHGHHLYSWNSGYWWLRREIRKNLGMEEPDPLDARVDHLLKVKRRDGYLSLEP